MLAHSFALTGRVPDFVAAEVGLLPVLNPSPNASCCSATTVPVAVLYTSAVSNLSSAPTVVDGYTLQNGDIVGLVAQPTFEQNKLYVATVGGGTVSLTALSDQPPDGALLRVTRGAIYLNSLWYFAIGGVALANDGGTGVIVGSNGTIVAFAPDPAGGTKGLIDNPGIDQQSIAADGAWHTMYSFDCVGRGFTSGAIDLTCRVIALDGTKPFRATVMAVGFCSATPATPIQRTPDIDDDGSGPYVAVQIIASGSAFLFQVKNLQGSTVTMKGIGSYQVYVP